MLKESFEELDFALDPSLVLYLPLHKKDGAAFTSDDAYGHLCTVTGAIWTPQGRVFDGNDSINCGTNPVLALARTDSTIEAWLKINDFLNTSWLARYTATGGGNGWIFTVPADEKLHFRFLVNGVSTEAVSNNTLDTYGMRMNRWFHIAAVREGNTGYLYFDGNSIATTSGVLGALTGNSASLKISGTDYAWVLYGQGKVGEVKINTRASSSFEIKQDYLATKWRYQ